MCISPWPPSVPAAPPRPCAAACSPGLAVLRRMTGGKCRRSRRTHQAASGLRPPQSASEIWRTMQKNKMYFFIYFKVTCTDLSIEKHWHGWYIHNNLYCIWLCALPDLFRSLHCISMSLRKLICWHAYLMFPPKNSRDTHTHTHKVRNWLRDLTTVCPPSSPQAAQCPVPGRRLQPNLLYIPTRQALYCSMQHNKQMDPVNILLEYKTI